MKQYKFSVEEIKKLTKSMVILVDSGKRKTLTYWTISGNRKFLSKLKNWNTAIIRL